MEVLIGHRTAGLHKPGPGKGNESRADPRQHGEGWWREKEKELQGRTGVRYTLQRQTELVGGRVLRPYVPHGMKWIGEDGLHNEAYCLFRSGRIRLSSLFADNSRTAV